MNSDSTYLEEDGCGEKDAVPGETSPLRWEESNSKAQEGRSTDHAKIVTLVGLFAELSAYVNTDPGSTR